jgi:hypothetical protein
MAKLPTNGIDSQTGNFHTQWETTFTHQSNTYYKSDQGLLIKLCERKKPDALKPLNYLMQRHPSGEWKYLSSLYDRTDHKICDINGITFRVFIHPNDSITLERK